MAGPTTNTTLTIKNVFDTTSTTDYRVRGQIYVDTATATGLTIKSANNGAGQVTLFGPMTITGQAWYGFDFRTTITTAYYANMQLYITRSSSVVGWQVYLKNLAVEKIVKAQISDTDMLRAGRRTAYYEGCKMTSQDINVNSPDTIDGGPVVVVNVVGSNTPSSSPIGSTISRKTKPQVNQTLAGTTDTVGEPLNGRVVVNVTNPINQEGRGIVNVTATDTGALNGRGIVNINNPTALEGRAVVNLTGTDNNQTNQQ